MTSLAIHWDQDPAAPVLEVEGHQAVTAHLAEAGVLFGRWHAAVALPDEADEAAVTAAYAAPIERLKLARGYQSADIVRVRPDTPGLDALRVKFLAEHTHDEDEARFFVAGSGTFFLHLGRRVFRVACGPGDLISVPAGIRHWFDMGARPSFTAIRFFTRPDGWVAAYTGDPIAERFAPQE